MDIENPVEETTPVFEQFKLISDDQEINAIKIIDECLMRRIDHDGFEDAAIRRILNYINSKHLDNL